MSSSDVTREDSPLLILVYDRSPLSIADQNPSASEPEKSKSSANDTAALSDDAMLKALRPEDLTVPAQSSSTNHSKEEQDAYISYRGEGFLGKRELRPHMSDGHFVDHWFSCVLQDEMPSLCLF